MGIFSKMKSKKVFDDAGDTVASSATDAFLRRCADIYAGHPDWAGKDGITTVNFARTVCAETARLAMLGVRYSVSGGERANWLRGELDRFFPLLRRYVELACAHGTVILKPNGSGVDCVTPDRFTVTETDCGRITGVIFRDERRGGDGKLLTRLEFHRFIGDVYAISNRCVSGDQTVPLERTPWAGLAPDVRLEGVSRPLFGVLRMPSVNNLDPSSPLGLPVFADALHELYDLDVAVSRASREVYDSRRTVLLDSDRLMPTGRSSRGERGTVLPDFVKTIYGCGTGDIYHEINPTLNTESRLLGINAILFGIGVKCGFSSGYFSADGQGGVRTATEVEANDRRTIEHIRDVRDSIEDALGDLVYAMERFGDLYGTAPAGDVDVMFDFGDITYNREEDRKRWFEYVKEGYVPFSYFLERFEGVFAEALLPRMTRTRESELRVGETPRILRREGLAQNLSSGLGHEIDPQNSGEGRSEE